MNMVAWCKCQAKEKSEKLVHAAYMRFMRAVTSRKAPEQVVSALVGVSNMLAMMQMLCSPGLQCK